MDLGFLIVVLAVVMPFAVLGVGYFVQRQNRQKAALQRVMMRIGFEKNQQKRIQAMLKNSPKLFFLNWLNTQLKKAGLRGRKHLVRLLAVQAGLTFFSAYLLSTRYQSLDEKSLAVALCLPLLPTLFVALKKKQRQNRLRQQFPEMLDAIVRSLHSGFGIDGALSMVAEEFSAPLGQEVKEVNRQLTLGISMRDILRDFQTRVEIPEAQFFVVALIIQRETGGQLASILESLSKLMRRRDLFQAKLRTMTAESRFTAVFIGFAPLAYLGYKYFFDRESMDFFLHDPLGFKMLLVSLALMATGGLILKSMLRIKF